jgi:two-component system, OmpR family, sensor histidine kinase VanS
MKHSIRFKITLTLTIMVVLTIFVTWFINRTFLSNYYVYTKIMNLDTAYQEIKEIYDKSEDDVNLSEKDTVKLEQLASKYSVDIYVINSLRGFIYPASFGEREFKQMLAMQAEYLARYMNPDITDRRIIKETGNYRIIRLYDIQKEANYIDMVGLYGITFWELSGQSEIGDGAYGTNRDRNQDFSIILLRSNFESIEEGVGIANTFLAYVGILAVIIGSMAMLIISKRFTRPILELAGIAKRISDLDFEVKYRVETKDEIGELGNSINSLSEKLESTITELKQANNELLTDIQKKTELDEMRKEFLSNVSHELKTPISLIQGYAEGLKENINEDPESRDFYCEVIIDEADRMNKMVKKLLNLNEIEFGNNQVNFVRFDIVTLIRSVLSSTEILFKQKEVILHFDQTEPIYVWADEYMVEQVVTNYISNALNHVSGQRIIEIKLIPRDDRLRVAVFNTGENIPEEDLDKIWIKFYKVDKARTREYGGNGIGLSIVKAIMNSLNQDFGVINRQIGVEFWFELDTKS